MNVKDGNDMVSFGINGCVYAVLRMTTMTDVGVAYTTMILF